MNAESHRAALLRSRLENLQTIWVTVDLGGTTRFGVPYDRPELDVFGPAGPPAWLDPMGSPLDLVLGWAMDFLTRYPDFVALVSVLIEAPDAVRRVLRKLPQQARDLDGSEYQVLHDLGMDLPFGPWAERDRARIFLLEYSREEVPA